MTAKNPNPIKPKIGLTVRLTEHPGTWQCLSQSPKRGGWWVMAVDDEARAVGKWALEATTREMLHANK